MTQQEEKPRIDQQTIAAMQACVVHARALLESARAVEHIQHPNVAYHLAILALEELGRRELLQVNALAARQPDPPAWPEKHTQDHVKKLFWCFFGNSLMAERTSPKALNQLTTMVQNIHAKRLEGLYVGSSDEGLSIPHEAITPEECAAMIEFAAASLALAESEKLRDHIPREEIELQAWFLKISGEPDKRRMVFSSGSLAKLAELNDGQAWIQWLKGEFDNTEAEGRLAIEEELRRSQELPDAGTKEKWKLRFRIFTASHSIRPKALSSWNAKIEWIKLVPAKKNELIVEIILKDNVPVDALYYFGWGLARHLVAALNIATMGFWWWRLPEQVSRYYETLEDLDKKMKFVVERNPSLKVDWGGNRVLTEEDLDRAAACLVALPGPDDREKQKPYDYYTGGLTFLSLNDIHWQCEPTVFGNFFHCLREMMRAFGDWTPGTRFPDVATRFLAEMFPTMEERDQFAELFARFEDGKTEGAVVTLKEASFMKLFCDAYFMNHLQEALRMKGGDIPDNE